MATELTFEEQQASAYGFLDAFYNRADFGYDVQHWGRDKLKSNRLAWAVVTQVMAREKQNIELAFNGFI